MSETDIIQNKFSREFYLQDTHHIARSLLGCYLISEIDSTVCGGMIVEAESYLGTDDKASHSQRFGRTKRTEIQFGLGGFAYIFQVYGMYYQFCLVTGTYDVSDVVLIRALEPIFGVEKMMQRRKVSDIKSISNGPGKLCNALGITKEHYAADLCGNIVWLAKSDAEISDNQIVCAPRIGIEYADDYKDKLWRYYIKDNKFVSKK